MTGPLTRRLGSSGVIATIEPDPFQAGAYILDVDGTPQSHIFPERPDELFFEYHFYEDYRTGWYFGWFFTPLQIRSAPTVDDALALMQRLRALGIRAHFWT